MKYSVQRAGQAFIVLPGEQTGAETTFEAENDDQKRARATAEITRMKPERPPREGVGTFLKTEFSRLGVPSCQACANLAERMNDWGADGCRERLDKIVSEIVERAANWERDGLPWYQKILLKTPEALQRAAVRRMVLVAIDSEEERIRTLRRYGLGVAVVVVSHNYGRFLAEAIESVRSQTLAADEIIVVDDSSTDDTREVAESLGVRYVRIDERHVTAARRAGLEHTTAPLLCFLDADDRLPSDYLSESVTLLHEDLRTVIVHSDIQRFGLSDEFRRYPNKIAIGDIARENSIHAGAVVRRTAIETSGALYRRTHSRTADWHLWQAVLEQGGVARKSPAIYEYRDHDASMTRLDDSDFYARANLKEETVSLLMPLSGRVQCWERLSQFLERQAWPHDQIALRVLDTSQSAEFGRRVREWLLESDYRSVAYEAYAVGRAGLADEPRAGAAPVQGDIERAMLRIWRRLTAGVGTRYTWTIEDDVIPPDDVLESLLRQFLPDVDAVAAPYRSRFGEYYTLRDGRNRSVAKRGRGVQRVGAGGFGCTVFRSEVLREHAWVDANQTWYDIWFFQSRNLHMLVNWDCEAAHLDESSACV